MNNNQGYGQYQTPDHNGYGYGYAGGNGNARGREADGRGVVAEGFVGSVEGEYPRGDTSQRRYGVHPHEQGQRVQMAPAYGQQQYLANGYAPPAVYGSAMYGAPIGGHYQQSALSSSSSPSQAYPSPSHPMVVIPQQSVRMMPQPASAFHLQQQPHVQSSLHPAASHPSPQYQHSHSPSQQFYTARPPSQPRPSPQLSNIPQPLPRLPDQLQASPRLSYQTHPSPQLTSHTIHSPRIPAPVQQVPRMSHQPQQSPRSLLQPQPSPQPSPQLHTHSPQSSSHPGQSPRFATQAQPLPQLQSHLQPQPQAQQNSWHHRSEQQVHQSPQAQQYVTNTQQQQQQQQKPNLPSIPPKTSQASRKPQVIVEIPIAPTRPSINQPQNSKPQDAMHAQKVAASLPASNQRATTTSSIKKPTAPTAPPVDYQRLLLLLAEDYINAAHAMGTLAAFYRRSEDLKQYFHLIATALGCIEASLTEFSLLPHAEALLTLQYANLLFHETENYDVVEEYLSKTIPLCERNKLLDLKYSMQHLSARTLFITKPRVAIKSLDNLIPNVQAYKHVPWIYALRFLRVSFSLRADAGHHDLAIAIQNLSAISEVAAGQSDAAVAVISATFEALLQLRSMNTNCVEEAQRAIASAKQYQLHPLVQSLSSIWALVDCIDLVCYLMQYNPDTSVAKVTKLAPLIEQLKEASKNEDDGVVFVPLTGTPGSLTENTSGIFQRIDGKDHLTFSWLHKRDLWTLCFLLSSIALQMKNPADPKVEMYLHEGLKTIKENFRNPSLSRADINSASSSFSMAARRMEFWCNLEWYFNLNLAVCFSNRGAWTKSQEHLVAAQECPAVSSLNKSSTRAKWETYLQGMIFQGAGRIDEALSIYQSPILELPQGAHRVHDAETDVCILAVLNSILIILNPDHPQHFNAELLHACVEPFIHSHPNKSLYAAHSLIKSILNPTQKLTEKKQYLMACFNSVRNLNTQLTCIALSLMYTVFFKDVLGDQSRKSAMSARQLAEKAGMPLWRGVTAGLVETTERSHGHDKEADRAALEAEKWVDGLPEIVKSQFAVADEVDVVMKVEEDVWK